MIRTWVLKRDILITSYYCVKDLDDDDKCNRNNNNNKFFLSLFYF